METKSKEKLIERIKLNKDEVRCTMAFSGIIALGTAITLAYYGKDLINRFNQEFNNLPDYTWNSIDYLSSFFSGDFF